MKFNKITKFGKVPLNRKVLILNSDNNWGVGEFFKWTKDSMGEKADGRIYCNFHSTNQLLLGEKKCKFLGWIELPETK